MEDSDDLNQIKRYLDKNYFIRENKFFTRYNSRQEWGYEINDSLVKIFSFDEEFCNLNLTQWAHQHGLDTEESLKKAWGFKPWSTIIGNIEFNFLFETQFSHLELPRILRDL